MENEGNVASMETSNSTEASPVVETHQDAAPVTEKMIPQSEVNKIVGRTRQEAAEKAYQRARQEIDSQSQPASQNVGGMKQMSEEQIRQMINTEAEKRAQMSYAENLVNDFARKMQSGASKYEDFDAVVSKLNLPSNPNLVRWANSIDNASDVMYDLGKNPEKYANVIMLSHTAPDMAVDAMMRLSDSIKRNEEAKSGKRADEPLDHLKPSNTGMDNGNLTVSDLRKADWLRG